MWISLQATTTSVPSSENRLNKMISISIWQLMIAKEFGFSSDGMKTLAADCMLIEAIGEGVKKIDNLTNRTRILSAIN